MKISYESGDCFHFTVSLRLKIEEVFMSEQITKHRWSLSEIGDKFSSKLNAFGYMILQR